MRFRWQRSSAHPSVGLALLGALGLGGCSGADDPAARPPRSGELVWLATGTGPAGQSCYAVAEAGDGTLVATCSGEGVSTWGAGTRQAVELTSAGGHDAVFLGLDPADGAVRWHVPLGSASPGPGSPGPGDDAAVARSARLADGRVAALVRVGGPLVAGPFELPEVTAGDLVLVVLDGAGVVEVAVRFASGGTWDHRTAASLEPMTDGGLLVSTAFEGTLTVRPGTARETVLTAWGGASRFNSAVVWLDAALGLTRVLQLGGEGERTLASAVPDPAGGATVAGYFTGSLTLGGQRPQTLTDPGTLGEAFVASLDNEGEPRWALAFGSAGEDWARCLARLPDGGLAVAGYYGLLGEGAPTLVVPGAAGSPLTGVPRAAACPGDRLAECTADQFVLTLDADGTPRWLAGVASPSHDEPHSLSAFPDGGLLVSGHASAPGGDEAAELHFSDGEVVAAPGRLMLAVRYAPDGTRTWTAAAAPASGYTASVLASGAVVQAGDYQAGAVFGRGEPRARRPAHRGALDAAVQLLAP